MKKIKVFLSYSYDEDNHIKWIHELATMIEEQKDIHLIYDKYDLSYKKDKNHFMEQAVKESDFIIIVASKEYVFKANNRKGGVGIETGLIAARHYSEIDSKGESTVIPILRNNPSKTLPTYLQDLKLRFDLDKYSLIDKVFDLINVIKEQDTIIRPQKINLLPDFKKSFSCADKLLSINYKNRKLINQDKSEKNKYQFWECSNPAKLYFLAFFPSTILKSAVELFILNNDGNIPDQIAVLKEKDSNTIEKYLKQYLDHPPIIYEYSYNKYLWDLCIEQNIKKKDSISKEPNYIPQDIYYYEEKENYSLKTPLDNDFLNKFIENDDKNSILMILATAGKGKTTLIEHYIDEIHKTHLENEDNYKKCIYISSETIKKYYSNNISTLTNIDTIYDLYNSYATYSKNSIQIDKTLFESALSNGNFVVIVDGLDEIITLYQDKFNLEKFLDSLEELNRDFGKCKIIVSSRIHYWKNNSQRKRKNITSLVLHGFDKIHTKRYLRKRVKTLYKNNFPFFSYKDEEEYKDTVIRLVEQVIDFTENEKLSPFIIDIICTTVEKQIQENKNGFKIKEAYTYPCNNEVIDKIIFSILNRETLRQNFEYMKTNDILEIIIELALKHGKVFSTDSLLEEIKSKNESISDKVLDSFRYSQFFNVTDNTFTFKYDILVNYFKCLYIFKLFSNPNKFYISYKELSTLYKSDSAIYNDVTKYFKKHSKDFLFNSRIILKELIDLYRNDRTTKYNQLLIEEAISSILYILLEINNVKDLSNKERIEVIKNLYGADKKIEYLFIYGNFHTLDFSSLEIWNSNLTNYKNFLNSNFYNTRFLYTIIKGIKATKSKAKIFDNITFDPTCELFNLKDNINDQDDEIIIHKLHTFLQNFYDESFEAFKISKKNQTEQNWNTIKILISYNFIHMVKADIVSTSYEVIENSQAKVRKFLKELTLDYDLSLIVNVIKTNKIYI